MQPTLDQLYAELSGLTTITPERWADFVSATPEQRAIIAEGWRGMSWAQDVDKLARVMAILAVVGAVAGVAGTVAGASTAIAGLRSL